MRNWKLLTLVALASCQNCHPAPESGTSLTVSNRTPTKTVVYISFGSDSEITADDWSFCEGSGLNCSFDLDGEDSRGVPNPDGKYVNATFSFDAAVGCGTTKAEANVNNPEWFDTLDVSLVDGFSNKIEITAAPSSEPEVIEVFGPPNGQSGNESMLGVFPYGCDICVERQNPPCGIPSGTDGCKAGTQYDPEPPCQWQGPTKGGGDLAVDIALVP